jgi:hypothetical protein
MTVETSQNLNRRSLGGELLQRIQAGGTLLSKQTKRRHPKRDYAPEAALLLSIDEIPSPEMQREDLRVVDLQQARSGSLLVS